MDATHAAVRPSARAAVIAMTLAVTGVILISSSASAAAVIGSPVGNLQCTTGMDTVQMASTGASYAVPAGGGSITNWSTGAGADTGPAALLVWRPTTTAGTYSLVGESPLMTLAANSMNTFTLTTPIAVQAGDLIGLRLQGAVDCVQSAPITDTLGYGVGTTPPVGSTEAMNRSNGFTLNVAATVSAATTNVPTSREQCENGRWRHHTYKDGRAFRSQAACIKFVEHHDGHGPDDGSGDE